VKRLPFLSLGLLLLSINLIVPVFLQELYAAGVINFNDRNLFIIGDLLGIPVGAAVIYLVYMRSKDAGTVYPLFWIWLLASLVSVSCYLISLSISSSSNSYFYYISDLICLGIGIYLTFVPSAPEEIMVKSSL
jgi:hypothetical protein